MFLIERYINLICLSNLMIFFVLLCLLHLLIRYLRDNLRCNRFSRFSRIRTRLNVLIFGTIVPSDIVAKGVIPKSIPIPSVYSGNSDVVNSTSSTYVKYQYFPSKEI